MGNEPRRTHTVLVEILIRFGFWNFNLALLCFVEVHSVLYWHSCNMCHLVWDSVSHHSTNTSHTCLEYGKKPKTLTWHSNSSDNTVKPSYDVLDVWTEQRSIQYDPKNTQPMSWCQPPEDTLRGPSSMSMTGDTHTNLSNVQLPPPSSNWDVIRSFKWPRDSCFEG